MGTTTFYLKRNDLGLDFGGMSKKDLKELDKLSPYGEEKRYMGWSSPMELHNGNVYILVWWQGRLMKLEDAPKLLNKKYYDRYRGKTHNIYEWTLLKSVTMKDLGYLDKEFKKSIRREGKKDVKH
jgi:hypothetical protein